MAVCLAPPAARAQEAGEDAAGRFYPISRFELRYVREHAELPALDSLMGVSVRLGTADDRAFVAPAQGEAVVQRTLAELSDGTVRRYGPDALQQILRALSDALMTHGFMGVYVAPDPLQITEDGVDERPEGQTDLRIMMVVGVVDEMRTLARRERIPEGERVNHPLHERLKTESPVAPGDVLREEELDEYALLLSRHPGRRVDVALSPSPELGGVTLDYIVTEVKPWLVYAQVSNTGTENTADCREQFGFRHYQLTNNDDILAVDYATSCFDSYNSINVEYDSRLGRSNVWRWRIFGDYSEYTASDVGLFSDTFEGESWRTGGELRWNFFQDGPLFCDVGAGMRFEHQRVSDTLPGSVPGEEDFLIPYLLLKFERVTETSALYGTVTTEWQPFWLNDVSERHMATLGRGEADDSWTRMLWDISQSVYLEWLLDPEAWRDVSTPESSTLAHELYFRTAGQTTFGKRVIPQHEMAVGGLYTVRGYEQSVVAGDDVFLGTAEYRFHVPKAMGLESEPRQLFGQPFRFAPQQVYGPTDWDLIFRGFVDAACVRRNEGETISEDGDSLIGTGLGVEVRYRRNVTFRMDWGVALKDIDNRVSSGSQQFHFVVTLLY
jgi:hemolysin activation/secretion protein